MDEETPDSVRGFRSTARGLRGPRLRLALSFAVLAAFLVLIGGCASRYDELDLTMYKYRDTRNLVKFVYDASRILSRDGEAGLSYLQSHRKDFQTEGFYLYVYDAAGTNLFHAGMPELEGKNLWDVKDKDGKPAFQLAVQAMKDPSNPHAWVQYSWWEPGSFYPVPKASCHFAVTTPEGRELVVGGGIDYPHEEPEFIRIVVDDAVSLIEREGAKALTEIADPASEFVYRDVRVFVFRRDGEMVISPAINSTFSQTNLLECVDEAGQKPFVQALETLKSADSVWGTFMAKSPYDTRLKRKTLYTHKVMLSDEEVYVAAVTDLPEPPY